MPISWLDLHNPHTPLNPCNHCITSHVHKTRDNSSTSYLEMHFSNQSRFHPQDHGTILIEVFWSRSFLYMAYSAALDGASFHLLSPTAKWWSATRAHPWWSEFSESSDAAPIDEHQKLSVDAEWTKQFWKGGEYTTQYREDGHDLTGLEWTNCYVSLPGDGLQPIFVFEKY